MIDISDDERRRAFSVWLRSGRLPSVRSADGIELKFNPWHDPESGRFTFAGAGRHYGQWGGGGFPGGGGGKGGGGGATGSGDWPARSARPKSQSLASRVTPKVPAGTSSKAPAHKPSAQGTWTGGGNFGGAGATGTWGSPDRKRPPAKSQGFSAPVVSSDRIAATNRASTRRANAPSEQFRTVVRNGYAYQIDPRGRTRRVSGVLTVADAPIRSQTSQRQAGGVERRTSDDGGHYIAARFNGPTEAFNHFAQDANFNRGRYRVLEDEWARDKRVGRSITVKIVPRFDGGSVRPSVIDVWWTVDGKERSLKLPNERSERSRGER